MAEGMFITFEGLDFSGKSTQIQLLSTRLKEAGHNPLVVREPGGTPIGEAIRAILLDPANNALTEASELFLFEASRSQLVAEVIRPALQEGRIVLCDRYYDSTTAYQGYGRGLPLELLTAMNAFATENVVPILTFFLDIPLEEIERRIQVAKLSRDRMEANTREFYERVRNGYLTLARKEQRFRVLNGLESVSELHEKIWKEVFQQYSSHIRVETAAKEL